MMTMIEREDALLSCREIERDRIYDTLLSCNVCSEQTLMVACYLNGYTYDTVSEVLFFLTGCRDLKEFFGDEE